MKCCNQCKIEKPLDAFYKKKGSKDGRFWWCIQCHREYVKNKYHQLAADQTYRAAERKRINAYHKANPEKVKSWHKKYAAINGPRLNAKAKAYVLARERRTPSWLTADDLWILEEAYELAAKRTQLFKFPWQVDHIIPLHGRLVSGLHVPQNVQVIPATVNQSKSNRYAVA